MTTPRSFFYAVVVAALLTLQGHATPANWSRANIHWVDMAAAKDHAKALAYIKDGHIQPNIADQDGNTPLIMAANEGDFPAAQELVARGADVHARTDYHYDPLRAAISGRNPEIVALLLDHGADANDDFVDGVTPLMEAAERGSLPMVKMILAHGGKVELRNRGDGSNALSYAAEKGYAEVIALLIDRGANPNLPSHDGMTPLQWAALVGKLPAVRVLVQRGADINAQGGEYRMSPVHAACCVSIPGGDYDGVVKFLLESGAKPSLPDKNDRTALMSATDRQDVKAISLLAAHGADMKSEDGEGVRSLKEALERKWHASLQALLDAGVDPNAKLPLNETPLIYALERHDLAAIQVLAAAKADVNATWSGGIINSGPGPDPGPYVRSLLIVAVDTGSAPIVETLLKAGARPADKDSSGQTALDHARARKDATILQMLEAAGPAK